MDAAFLWLAIIGPTLIGLAAAIWFGDSKTLGLWTGFAGVVLLVLAGALQLQKFIWHSPHLATQGYSEGKNMTDENLRDPPLNIGGGGNIVTFGQSGGQNVINQAPKPDLKQLHNSILQNPDGSQTISILAEVVAPYPPGSLFVQATAPDIIDFGVIPQRTGMSVTGHSGKREDHAFTTLNKSIWTIYDICEDSEARIRGYRI